jgi:hypothetical protein
MATFNSFAAYADAVQKMNKDIDANTKNVAKDMGRKAQAIAAAEASADIGGSFSGWKRSNPIELDTKLKTIKNGVVMTPTRSSAGPWTVANQGRNHGNAGGFAGPGINRSSGTTSRTKSGGLRKVRAFKAKRWNGYTDPKHTADRAIARMERELDPIAERGVRKIQQRYFDVT